MGATVQVRDLDADVQQKLRDAAAREGLSLSAFLRRELTRVAARVEAEGTRDRWGISGGLLPGVPLEVASLLRKAVLRRQQTAEEAGAKLAAWAGNDVVRFAHAPFLSTIWKLRDNITPYDAAYVALTMHLGSTLLTVDHRLATAAARFCDVVALPVRP